MTALRITERQEMTNQTRAPADMDIAELQIAALQVDIAIQASRNVIKTLMVDAETTWVTIERLGENHPVVRAHTENLLRKMEISVRLEAMYGLKTWREWIALLMVEPVPADSDAASA